MKSYISVFDVLDKNKDSYEVFLAFSELDRITSANIGTNILSSYEQLKIDINARRRQCYYGSRNMYSTKSEIVLIFTKSLLKSYYNLLLVALYKPLSYN